MTTAAITDTMIVTIAALPVNAQTSVCLGAHVIAVDHPAADRWRFHLVDRRVTLHRATTGQRPFWMADEQREDDLVPLGGAYALFTALGLVLCEMELTGP